MCARGLTDEEREELRAWYFGDHYDEVGLAAAVERIIAARLAEQDQTVEYRVVYPGGTSFEGYDEHDWRAETEGVDSDASDGRWERRTVTAYAPTVGEWIEVRP